MKTTEKLDVREIRRKLGMNQQQFWSKLGVTQSGGSRYESGRNIPRPVQQLLRLVHVEQIDIAKVKREDFEVVEFLKANEPDAVQEPEEAGPRLDEEGCLIDVRQSGADLDGQPVFASCAPPRLSSQADGQRRCSRDASGWADGRARP